MNANLEKFLIVIYKNTLLVLSMFLCFPLAMEAQIVTKEDYNIFLEKAQESYQKGQFQACIQLCDGMLKTANNHEIHSLKALALFAEKKFYNADYHFTKAIENGDLSFKMYLYSGSAKIALKEFEEAQYKLVVAESKIESSGLSLLVYNNFLQRQAIVERSLGRYEAGEGLLRKAIVTGNSSANIDLLGVLLHSEKILHLRVVLDSINWKNFWDSDSVLSSYKGALHSLINNKVSPSDVDNLTNAINVLSLNFPDEFHPLTMDLLYLNYRLLLDMNKPIEAFFALKACGVYNPKNPKYGSELTQLKKSLNIDSEGPEVTIDYPTLDQFSTYIHNNTQPNITVIGTLTDESTIIEKKVLNRRSDILIERDGTFSFDLNLHLGRNEVTLLFTDSIGNKTTKEFVVEYRQFESRNEIEEITASNLKNPPALDAEAKNYAIFIAQQDYDDKRIPDLSKPINDAEGLKAVIKTRYEFENENIVTLLNSNKKLLLSTLDSITDLLSPNDNLLVFYAGHGEQNILGGGFLLPADATFEDRATYVSTQELVNAIAYSQGKHILFVVDACFGGALFRSLSSRAPQSIINFYSKNSREILTSGDLEKVPDNGEFLENLVTYLEKNTADYIDSDDIYHYTKQNVKGITSPQLNRITEAGDKGGKFVFFLRK
jgi:tetratricopeptide (TPR) repeat protein